MKKITFLMLHLGYGGAEQAVIAQANLLVEKYNVEIISFYKLYENPAFEVDPRIEIKYLTENVKPNREEIKKANGEDTTYLTVLASSGSFMVFSEGGIGTVLKDDMKLPQPANMPEQDSITLPTVTMEGLSEIDADHIIVIATESDKADLEASSVWSQIRAVKDGNVTILDASPYFSQAYNPIGRELILESVKDAVIK